MSWISDNYEKAALGGALIVALAFGASIYSNKDAVEDSFNRDSPKHDNNNSVPGLVKILEVKRSLSEDRHWNAHKAGNGREVNLMTGVPLFAKKGQLGTPVDLLVSGPVHPPIPNLWWLENEIDPGYSDSPELDPDEDGFSNREEFIAKTDPNEFDSHPNPISKLQVIGVKTTQAHLKPSDYGSGKVKFKLQSARGQDKNKMEEPVEVGQAIVFIKPLMQKRFKFKALEEKEERKNGITQKIKVWVIEDLKPNKAGAEYRFNKRGRRVDGGASGIVDSKVELSLPALRQGGATFKVEENMKFSLPFDEKSSKKPYLIKSVNTKTKTVEVEYADSTGQVKIHQMPYGK